MIDHEHHHPMAAVLPLDVARESTYIIERTRFDTHSLGEGFTPEPFTHGSVHSRNRQGGHELGHLRAVVGVKQKPADALRRDPRFP